MRQAFYLQALDGTYFELFRLLHDVRSKIKISTKKEPNSNQELVGDYAFDMYYNLLERSLDGVSTKEDISTVIYEEFSEYEVGFRQYNKLLGEIFNYIDEADIQTREKYKYIDFLTSSMTVSEFKLMFFNGFCWDNSKIFFAAKKYQIFNEDEIEINMSHFPDHYPELWKAYNPD